MDPLNCTESELSTFLQALAEEYLPTFCLDTNLCAPSKSISIASRSYPSGKKTVSFHGFPSLEMSRPLTDVHGEDLSKPSAGDSHARTSAAQGKEQELEEEKADSGSISEESLERLIPGLSLSKTPRYCGRADLALCCETLPRWGMMQDGGCWELATLKRPTFGKESGFWPTPSGVKDRGHCVGAISEWGGSSNRFRGTELRNLRCPDFEEWMMGWPVSWTELTPLETDKFQSWLQQHGGF